MVLTYRAPPRNSWSRTSSAIMRPDTSGKIGSWDRRGRVLRASISLVVIGFAASISTAAAQYLPPQPPPVGYPPPAYYPYQGYRPPAYYGYRGYPPPAYYRANPSAPFQGTDRDADGEAYDEEYDRPYPPQPRFGDAPDGVRSEPLAPPSCLATGSRHGGRGFAAGLSARAGADQRDTAPVPPHGRGLPDG